VSESSNTPAEADSWKEQADRAYVDRLDGAKRKLLLDHIPRAFPEVVEAGAGLVAEWRAGCAEHRRTRQRLWFSVSCPLGFLAVLSFTDWAV
jgi:hypothetical protein